MLTGTSYDDIVKMIDGFLEKENNKITTFYVMFYMFPSVYRIDYDGEEKEYTITLDSKESYDQMMSEDINDEEFIETMGKATIKIDNLNVYLAFNHIKDTKIVDSIPEIDDMRSHYTAMMDEIILETYDEDKGDEIIFSKVLFGENDSDDEDNISKYIISHYTYQNENTIDENMKALPSIETITFQDSDNVDLMIEELVSLGFGSTYSILESIAKRPQFVQASQESIDNELVIDAEYVAKEVGEDTMEDTDTSTGDDDDVELYSIDSEPIEYASDGEMVFGAKKKKTKKKKKNVKTLKVTTTNINRAFRQIKKQLDLSPKDWDRLLKNIPGTFVKCVYTYEGIESLCKSSGKTYHMITLGTCNCYEIKKNNKSFTVKPRGRSDKTIHDWCSTYKNLIFCYNATIANSFARVKEKITIRKLSDIDETIYKAWQQIKAYTLNFLIKGEIKPVTLMGSSIQSLYEAVITESKNKKEYEGTVLDEVGIIGWDGSNIYYTETNKTAHYSLDTDKLMKGLEKLLVSQDLLGKLDSWISKKQEEKSKKQMEKRKLAAEKAAKKNKNKKSYSVLVNESASGYINAQTTTSSIKANLDE